MPAASEQSHPFIYRDRKFNILLTQDGGLELWLAGVCRKRREPQEQEPQYVWTNVELEWEEHHYLEVRYWKSTKELKITVNREEIYLGGF